MKALMDIGTGTPDELNAVSSFLAQYKNTGGEGSLIDALVLAAHFLFKYGDDDADAALQKELDQSLTHPVLKKKLANNPPPKSEPAPASDAEEDPKATADEPVKK
jgi:hypothetical protein